MHSSSSSGSMRRICRVFRRSGPFKVVKKNRNHTCALQWPSTSSDTRFEPSDYLLIEKHWSASTRQNQTLAKHSTSDKQYVLSMFPYPSGQLHMGHVRVYSISDCLARFYRMRGKDVIHPIGWDAFGLPAENAARHNKLNPRRWTETNIEQMRDQLNRLGCNFDWHRELSTCSPDYYRWTQWLFTELYRHNLTERRWSSVNWDPVDQTVLADEQIDEKGRSWRSGAKAVKKLMQQWFVKTTVFTKPLYEGLDDLLEWRDVAAIQRNWIGPPQYFSLNLPLRSRRSYIDLGSIEVRVCDPCELPCTSHIAVRSTHSLCQIHAAAFGVDVKNGETLRCVAHDPIHDCELKIVVDDDVVMDDDRLDACLVATTGSARRSKTLQSLSADWNSFRNATTHGNKAQPCILQQLGLGGYATSSRLQDWVVSRQRYWGVPIPMVICDKCGPQPTANTDLPVMLPEVDVVPQSSKGSPLNAIPDWAIVECPSCHNPVRRECDTLDTFFDSSWYFLRYLDANNEKEAYGKDLADRYMPVDIYVGGKEHATLHLFYARFITHFLHSIGRLSHREPFHRLLPQGIIKGQTFMIGDGTYVPTNEVVETDDHRFVHSPSGHACTMHWEKMSKSKHNGVNPLDILSECGSDITRLLMMSNVSPLTDRNWNLEALKGIYNWLNRVRWCVNTYVQQRQALTDGSAAMPDSDALTQHDIQFKAVYNDAIKNITHHIQNTMLLNTAISHCHTMTSNLRKCPPELAGASIEYERCLFALVAIIQPFAPNIAAEFLGALKVAPPLDERWSSVKDINDLEWPIVDDDVPFEIEVMINGAHCERIPLDKDHLRSLNSSQIHDLVLSSERTIDKLDGRPVLNSKVVDLPDYGKQFFIEVEKEQKIKKIKKKKDKKSKAKTG